MATKPAPLAGGNPQIAKADGDAPVQAYIAAMPGWKRDVGRRLDALIVLPSPTCARPSSGTRPSTRTMQRDAFERWDTLSMSPNHRD